MNQQLIQGEGVGAGSVRLRVVVVVVVVRLDGLVAILVLVLVDDLVAPVISAAPRRRFLSLVVGVVVTLVLVVVDLEEPTNVDRRADANSSWLRLIYGSIEGHAPRGVLSTGAGEAQDGCKL